LSIQQVPEEQRKQMAATMYSMPIMMIFFGISSPAAVILYWFVGGIFSIIQQLITNYIIKPRLKEKVAEEFKKNLTDTKDGKGYLHYITVTSSSFGDFYAIEIPFENVIDCITICPRRMFQMRPSKLDRGYNAVTDVSFSGLKQSDYPISSGLALVRKWDGKKYVDDNNTTADFEVKVASLSRRDEKGNAIK